MESFTVDVWGTGVWSGIVEAEDEEEAKEIAKQRAEMEGLSVIPDDLDDPEVF